jgi:tRNA threonylcarbamoyladenosine biosynthesis protein TsaE
MLALPDAEATMALGARLAAAARGGDVLALWGELGAGKTTLARGFLQALGLKEEVPSPTFTLVQVYELSPPVWHFDLYRLTRADEVWELGLEQALAEGVALIEWPERLGALLPPDRLDVALSMDGDARRAELTPHGARTARPVTA